VHLDGTSPIELRSLRASRRDPRPVVRVELRGNDAHVERGLEYKRVAELPTGWALKAQDTTQSAPALAEEPLKAPEGVMRVSARLGLDIKDAWKRLTVDAELRDIVCRAAGVTVVDRERSPVASWEGEPDRLFFLNVWPADAESEDDFEPRFWFQLDPAGIDTCTVAISVRRPPDAPVDASETLSKGLQLLVARARELAPYTPQPETIERLRSLVGATYEAKTVVPTGETLRARTTWESWSHSTFVWHGRLGPVDAAELPEHTLMLYAVDPERGPRFWKFGADGSVATGAVLAHGPGGIAHDWHSSSPSGQERHIFVTLVPGKFDYRYVAQPSRSEATTLVDLMYVRQ